MPIRSSDPNLEAPDSSTGQHERERAPRCSAGPRRAKKAKALHTVLPSWATELACRVLAFVKVLQACKWVQRPVLARAIRKPGPMGTMPLSDACSVAGPLTVEVTNNT